MNDITLCTMHTEKPYYIKEINKNIYSIEELSYYLFNFSSKINVYNTFI